MASSPCQSIFIRTCTQVVKLQSKVIPTVCHLPTIFMGTWVVKSQSNVIPTVCHLPDIFMGCGVVTRKVDCVAFPTKHSKQIDFILNVQCNLMSEGNRETPIDFRPSLIIFWKRFYSRKFDEITVERLTPKPSQPTVREPFIVHFQVIPMSQFTSQRIAQPLPLTRELIRSLSVVNFQLYDSSSQMQSSTSVT